MNLDKQSSRRKIMLIIIAILAVLIAVVAGILMYLNSDAVQLQRQLDLGQKYLEEQNYEQAIVAFDKAIGIDPMRVDAYLGLAEAYECLGEYGLMAQTLKEGYDRTGDERLSKALLAIDRVIVWEDKAFESMIRTYLGKPQGDIYWSEVWDITELYIMGNYILDKNEELLSKSINADKHYLYKTDRQDWVIVEESDQGQIHILNDIQYFISIKQLYVTYNQVEDIYSLEKMNGLTVLNLTNNNIIDISALNGLTNLTELWLSNNNINDISVLKELTMLSMLHLGYCYFSEIDALSGLINLSSLSLESNNISDINDLTNLINLTNLSLDPNNINDISVLQNFTNLSWLTLDKNNISDISALQNLTKLETLCLAGNNIDNIDMLQNLTNLEYLTLDENDISDVSALQDLTKLEVLSLKGNNISDFSSVSFVKYLWTD